MFHKEQIKYIHKKMFPVKHLQINAGEPYRIRTGGLFHAMETLSQLKLRAQKFEYNKIQYISSLFLVSKIIKNAFRDTFLKLK